jgi:hypothetical protein
MFFDSYLEAGLRNPYFPENDEGFLLPAGALLRRAYLCRVQALRKEPLPSPLSIKKDPFFRKRDHSSAAEHAQDEQTTPTCCS